MRQGIGLAVAIVYLLYLGQQIDNLPQSRIPVQLPLLLLGVAFVVWSIEEYFRGNKVFTALFSVTGLLSVCYAVYSFLR